MMDEEVIVAAVINQTSNERIYLKRLRDASDPFDRSERKFLKLFRLSRQMALDLVSNLGRFEELQLGTIPAHLKILCALNFFGQGCYQTSVGELNIIAQSQPTVSRSISAVAAVIVRELTPQWIKFPTSQEEKERAMQEFHDNYGMPYTLGAIDGTHIGIQKPPINHPTAPGNLFYNRKGFYSINCQMVCNAKGEIINVNPNFPGSTHDAAIWRVSNVNRHLENEFVQNEQMQWLIGDKGYPLLPWLMTPHHEPTEGSQEQRYNKCHAQARVIIEMCFGRLKNTFRCLHRHRTLHYSPTNAAKIILSCCTLYNMLLGTDSQEHDTDTDTDSDEEEIPEDPLPHEQADEEVDLLEDGEQETNSYLSIARSRRAFLIRNSF